MPEIVRLRLDISYDGTDFSGWAIQPNLRTVAGELTDALQVLLREQVRLVVAGRTDAGVHATGQVAHVDVSAAALSALAPRRAGVPPPPAVTMQGALTAGAQPPGTAPPPVAPMLPALIPAEPMPEVQPPGTAPPPVAPMLPALIPAEPMPEVQPPGTAPPPVAAMLAARVPASSTPAADDQQSGPRANTDEIGAGRTGLLRRLAGVLPLDVRVRAVTLAPDGFDARFSALRRHYRYRIGTGEWGVEPADRRFVLARRRTLDTEAMSLAAAGLIGLRDFAAFCRPREGATTVRELQALTVRPVGDDEVHIDVTADAFCHSMVRALVGSLMTVGEMRVPVDRPSTLLAERRRSAEIHVVPAHGLTLRAVDYPPAAELALRARTARARRDPHLGGATHRG